MTVPPLKSALQELADEHLHRAEDLEARASRGERAQGDPIMEARRLRQLAEQARLLAEGIRF